MEEGPVLLWEDAPGGERQLWFGPRPGREPHQTEAIRAQVNPTLMWNVQQESAWATKYEEWWNMRSWVRRDPATGRVLDRYRAEEAEDPDTDEAVGADAGAAKAEFLRLPLAGRDYTVETAAGKQQLKRQLLKVASRLLAPAEDGRCVVYVHCHGGHEGAGHIALMVEYWVRGEAGFDPVQAQRLQCRFDVAQYKPQRKLVEEIKQYVRGTLLWRQRALQREPVKRPRAEEDQGE